VRQISFEGIPADRLVTVKNKLPLVEGKPLDPADLKSSLRQLFATGLYEDVEVEGEREGGGVALVFVGRPRTFIGDVGVYGAVGATMNTQLTRASQLEPGTRLTPEKMNRALDQMRTTLAENGYHQPAIYPAFTAHREDQLIDISFRVASGPPARAGKVTITGDSGINAEDFRRYAHLRTGARIDHDTVNRALDGVRAVRSRGQGGEFPVFRQPRPGGAGVRGWRQAGPGSGQASGARL
jgi:outer membrane protein assembly factor BamA